MATAKKKASAKRTAKPVKYAAKAAASAARQTSSTAQQASKAASKTAQSWINSGSEQWQKGAQDWAKQSAKLYQLPFAQGDVNQATQKAAEQVKSATENMVKMGNDMMQQMFSAQGKSAAGSNFDASQVLKQFQQSIPQLSNFDASDAQAKFSAFARDSQEQLSKASKSASKAGAEASAAAREFAEVLNEVANIATSVSKELGAETISFLNKQFAQNVELGKQAMTCRTLNDMFDLSNRITKTNLDAVFSQCVKVSETLFQCATDISEPLNEVVSNSSARLSKAIAS